MPAFQSVLLQTGTELKARCRLTRHKYTVEQAERKPPRGAAFADQEYRQAHPGLRIELAAPACPERSRGIWGVLPGVSIAPNRPQDEGYEQKWHTLLSAVARKRRV
jgi:hypothetical protein